ncbi:MAG: PrgI family protein [Parcubacteria group bacterium ADurb.Bin305]|nr:MAG: PrgI family protein [Parcubacteria group bacterium ADurb.Bin305]
MSYPVPQFINEETRILGVLTFTQLNILAGVTFLILILCNLVTPSTCAIIAVVLGLPTAFLLFGRLEGIPMYKLLPHILRHFWLPSTYLWQKNLPDSQTLKITKSSTLKSPNGQPKKPLDPQTLKQLADHLDQ